MFLVPSLFFFVWFPCGRLSWLHVSFWAHVNIVHHIISYSSKENLETHGISSHAERFIFVMGKERAEIYVGCIHAFSYILAARMTKN